MTRSNTPIYGADSTLVYPSKLASDVNASVTFQLKDSAIRDALKQSDKDRTREINRLKRERRKLLASIDREESRQRKLEAKRKAEAEKTAKKAKGKKAKRSQKAATEAPKPAPVPVRLRPDPALRDSVAAIDLRLRALMVEDSIAGLAPWKIKRPGGGPADEHVFDIEEGARVQATIHLENVYARGKRPLMFHFVWLNPARKRVFKRMVEYMPNDSSQTLTSSMTITPLKRSAGHYAVQVFLFREQIAEKPFELRGQGVEEQQKRGEDAM